MKTEEYIINFIGIVLGSGIGVAIVNAILSHFAESNNRKIQYLKEQIQELYSPLYFLVIQIEELFKLNKELSGAYHKEYIEKKYSDESSTQENLNKDAGKVISIRNKYVELANKNKDVFSNILKKYYHYLDSDDEPVIADFYRHYVRSKVEINETGKLETPLQIYHYLEEISIFPQGLIDRIKLKFEQKKDELEDIYKKKS